MGDPPIPTNSIDSGGSSIDSAAHDVLAAEEFALPARDPGIGHAAVVLPEDPSGIVEPHDVLAAEEFALPAPAPRLAGTTAWSTRQRGRRGAAGAIGAVGLLILARIVRRR